MKFDFIPIIHSVYIIEARTITIKGEDLNLITEFLEVLWEEEHISHLIFINLYFVFVDYDGGLLLVRNWVNLSYDEGQLPLGEGRHVEGG